MISVVGTAGQVNEAGIQDVTLTGAHGAAETLYSTAPSGQSSAVHATVGMACTLSSSMSFRLLKYLGIDSSTCNF